MASKIIFSVIVLLALAQLGLSYRCYKCTTQEHGEACEKPEGSQLIVDCAENQACVAYVYIDTGANTRTYNRGCGAPTECQKSKAIIIGCKACEEDLCNN